MTSFILWKPFRIWHGTLRTNLAKILYEETRCTISLTDDAPLKIKTNIDRQFQAQHKTPRSTLVFIKTWGAEYRSMLPILMFNQALHSWCLTPTTDLSWKVAPPVAFLTKTWTPSISDPKISPDRYFTIKQVPFQTRSDQNRCPEYCWCTWQ